MGEYYFKTAIVVQLSRTIMDSPINKNKNRENNSNITASTVYR